MPSVARDYGFFECVIVGREGLVAIESNRYSVPAHLIGRTLTARIHRERIELFADQERVASHVRHPGGHACIIDPAHFEAAFTTKPRGRVMVYRDWLCRLSPVVMSYVSTLSHKRRAELAPQMTALYDLVQEMGKADFVAALELLAEQQMYGAEYVRALLTEPVVAAASPVAHKGEDLALPAPAQWEVERDLRQYEQYVANRDSVLESGVSSLRGAPA